MANALTSYVQTASTLAVFILAMVLYPECQIKAQEEIDRVIGSSRLPNFNDRGSLPYVECLLQETLRYMIFVPCDLVFSYWCIPDGIQ